MRRKPNSLHVFNGTYRADRHGRGGGASFPRKGKLEPPDWLPNAGKAKFKLMVEQLDAVPGLLADIDVDQLAFYSEAYAEFVAASEQHLSSLKTALAALGRKANLSGENAPKRNCVRA